MAKTKMSSYERITSGRLNRNEFRTLKQKVLSDDPGLSIVHPNAGGIDVGSESHFVAVPPDRDPTPVQEFGFWTADLARMAQWLISCRIDTVALQATGVYWIPLFDVLTEHGIEVFVVNALFTKNPPGRKTDIQECRWLMKLHTYGLLGNSFQRPEQIENLSTIWRLRDQHVKEASRCTQHMQKALTKMNIQIANVFSDISGVSGQAIIGAILAGERDPDTLANLKHERAQASHEEVVRSLEGHWRDDVLFELRQANDAYHFAHKQMRECDVQLELYLAKLPTRTIGGPADPISEPGKAAKPKRSPKKPKPKGNAPAFDIKSELTRIAGVDLTSIDGIDVMTAQTFMAEIGSDLSSFPTENHLVSWLGLTPRKDISGGKVVGHSNRKVQNRVAMSFRIAATSLLNSKSYLGAKYRHLRSHLPSKSSAVKAMARHLAILVYRLLTKGQAWVDQGAARFEKKKAQSDLANLTSKAAAQGYKLVPIEPPAQ